MTISHSSPPRCGCGQIRHRSCCVASRINRYHARTSEEGIFDVKLPAGRIRLVPVRSGEEGCGVQDCVAYARDIASVRVEKVLGLCKTPTSVKVSY